MSDPFTGMDNSARILLFRLPGDESARNAAALARTMHDAGYQPVIVPYWHDDTPCTAEADPLLKSAFGDAESLSRFSLHRRLGLDLELIDLSAHSLAFPRVEPDVILQESVWNRKLRGAALLAAGRIAEVRPEAVLIPHGGEVFSRILAAVAAHTGTPYLYWESSFFPGYHFIDPYAPHFFRGECRADRRWAINSDPALLRAAGQAYMAKWRAAPVSKYAQQTDPTELAALDRWLGSSEGRVLFIPGQYHLDGTVLVNLNQHPDLASVYRAALSGLPAGWRVIFKHHPLHPLPAALPEGNTLFCVRAVGLSDLFKRSATVALHSSTVGLEALMAGLPVITWGQPVYAGKGATIDISDASELGSRLQNDVPSAPDVADVERLIGHILTDALVGGEDSQRLRSVISEAQSLPPAARLPAYGRPVRQLAEAIRSLDAGLRGSMPLEQALATLPPDQHLLLQGRSGNGLKPPTRNRPPELEPAIGDELRRRIGLDVHTITMDLPACPDPAGALREAIKRTAALGIAAVYVRQAGDSDLHALSPGDLEDIAGRLPDLTPHVFCLDGRKLRLVQNAADTFGPYLVLFEDARNANVNDTVRQAIESVNVSFAPVEITPYLQCQDGAHACERNIITIPAGDMGTVVYGPYMALPAGQWEVRFDLVPTQTPRFPWSRKPGLGGFVMDVHNTSEGILATHEPSDMEHGELSLAFISSGQGEFEFRIFRSEESSAASLQRVTLFDRTR
ncbi:hypothetical protein ACLBXM_14550 [Xanthobacteraceae bacterium A53D]